MKISLDFLRDIIYNKDIENKLTPTTQRKRERNMNEERYILAEALWKVANEEYKKYIVRLNNRLTETSDEKYDEVYDFYRDNAEAIGMSEEMFDALDLAYTIRHE